MSFSLSASWFELEEIPETRMANANVFSTYILLNGRRIAILTDCDSTSTVRHDNLTLTLYSLITNRVVELWPTDQKMSWSDAFAIIANTDPDVILGEQKSLAGQRYADSQLKLKTRMGLTVWIAGCDNDAINVTLDPTQAIWMDLTAVNGIVENLLADNTSRIELPILGDQPTSFDVINRQLRVTRSAHI